jgi:predicted RNA-binding Zn-ribbon protein involved in translation (DUF1610 family)
MSIIEFKSPAPAGELVGVAKCMSCSHEWVATGPIGNVWFECPECGAEKGYLLGPVQRPMETWECACGNPLFYVTREGLYCPHCGSWQVGF